MILSAEHKRDATPRLDGDVAIPWVVGLRWVAFAGQAAALAFAKLGADADLPYAHLALLWSIGVSSNLAVMFWLHRHAASPPTWLVPLLLSLDAILFTDLCRHTGGASNPFALLFIVYIALSAVVCSAAWTWWIAGLSAAGYALLFVSAESQGLWHVPVAFDVHAHLVGMWVAVTLVATVITYFIGRIMQALRGREQAIAELELRAERNERLAGIASLAAGAAHELGSPLGTIAVTAHELKLSLERAGAPEGQREDAELIRAQTERCREILDRLGMAGGEMQADPPTEFSLRTLAEHVGQDLDRDPERVEWRFADPEREVTGSLREFSAALVPLIQNAIDASPETERVAVEPRWMDDELVFEVVDHGAGMAADVLARAGEPFFTTKAPGRGTGLGLHVARLLAQQLGGRLELRSSPGEGTQASLWLPVGVGRHAEIVRHG